MKLFSAPSGWLARLGRARGFSLPETTIAVAIAALGIVSIMGLIPQGMETAHKTSNLSAQSRIMQEIIGELQTEDWSKFIGTGNFNNRTYDDQGILISNGTGTSSSNSMVTYVAKIQINTTLLPGSTSTTGNGEPYLRRLTVNIASTSNPAYTFPPTDAQRFKTVSFLLTKLQ